MMVMTTPHDRISRPWMEHLPEERPRLVRLCARLTGSYEAAEDLAQETLFEAWRQAGNLRDEVLWRAFVSGIARNVCLRWLRRQGQESAHRARAPISYIDSTNDSLNLIDIEPSDSFSITENFERQELASLLDRAMNYLPGDSRSLLIERYIDEKATTEMAQQRGLTENALGVRIHRAKDHLQRLLNTTTFREEALSYGLLSPESADGWEETRLWCPRCGNEHLMGRFVTSDEGDPQFALRCPGCDNALGQDFTSRHVALPTEQVLGGIKGFKPALNRISNWWHHYFEQGRRQGYAPCHFCGRTATLLNSAPIGADPRLAQLAGLFVTCSHCNRLSCMTASGIAFHRPEVQRFWREHPRLQLLAETPIEYETEPSVLVQFRSVTDSAILEAVLSTVTFEMLSVEVVHSVKNP